MRSSLQTSRVFLLRKYLYTIHGISNRKPTPQLTKNHTQRLL
jgi:hypothetical protein